MADGKPTRRPPNFKDLTGQVFDRLTVIGRDSKANSEWRWLCLCKCGQSKIVRGSCLRNGVTRSCGCYRDEQTRAATSTHGKSNTREYRIWKQAKNRCFSPAVKGYDYYGARGITMCEDWKKDFAAFYRDMGPCPLGLTLERINNDGHYEPGNCKWASRVEQARNTRDATFVTHEGETLHLKEWAERTGIQYKTLHSRHRHGRPLFAPVKSRKQ